MKYRRSPKTRLRRPVSREEALALIKELSEAISEWTRLYTSGSEEAGSDGARLNSLRSHIVVLLAKARDMMPPQSELQTELLDDTKSQLAEAVTQKAPPLVAKSYKAGTLNCLIIEEGRKTPKKKKIGGITAIVGDDYEVIPIKKLGVSLLCPKASDKAHARTFIDGCGHIVARKPAPILVLSPKEDGTFQSLDPDVASRCLSLFSDKFICVDPR